jgi:hypothetical protein
MWKYALLRIKGIRAFDQVDAWLPNACKTKDRPKLTIGDIITSERGMAVVLRLHVRFSLSLILGRKAILRAALQKVMAAKAATDVHGNPIKWEMPPVGWTAEHEVALVDAIVDCVNAKQRTSVEQARYWPLSVRNGKPIEKEVTVGNKKEKRFVLASTASWIPDSEDPADYAPDDERDSFKFST